ncbi:hypothetical protein ACVINI_004908 [Rhizobium beringeri]
MPGRSATDALTFCAPARRRESWCKAGKQGGHGRDRGDRNPPTFQAISLLFSAGPGCLEEDRFRAGQGFATVEIFAGASFLPFALKEIIEPKSKARPTDGAMEMIKADRPLPGSSASALVCQTKEQWQCFCQIALSLLFAFPAAIDHNRRRPLAYAAHNFRQQCRWLARFFQPHTRGK